MTTATPCDNVAPDGFNFGINAGETAGRTIFGDVENPRGGVRGVIPQRQQH